MVPRRSTHARFARFGLALAVAVPAVVVCAIGCGDSTKANPPQQTKSATTDIPPDLGSSWTDAAVPDEVSATAACTRMLRASCERKNECGLGSGENGTDDCAKAVARCPDAMFSTGSTGDPTQVWQCASTMRERSCHDVYFGIYPDCYKPGTKQAEEGCIAGTQCASLLCAGGSSKCGTCVARVGEGKSCSEATKVACDVGLTCDFSSKTCVDLAERTFDGAASTGVAVGKPCTASNDCVIGAYCRVADSGEAICAERIAENGDCKTSESCVAGTYCYPMNNRCTKVPEPGHGCGIDPSYFIKMWCADGAYCDAKDEMCKGLPTAGEPCVASGGVVEPTLCAANAYCDTTADPPTCLALAGPTEKCDADAKCIPGTHCLCQDAECKEKSCGLLRDIGESCAEVGEMCNTVSTCTDGTCKANGSQDLFKSLCGG